MFVIEFNDFKIDCLNMYKFGIVKPGSNIINVGYLIIMANITA